MNTPEIHYSSPSFFIVRLQRRILCFYVYFAIRKLQNEQNQEALFQKYALANSKKNCYKKHDLQVIPKLGYQIASFFLKKSKFLAQFDTLFEQQEASFLNEKTHFIISQSPFPW